MKNVYGEVMLFFNVAPDQVAKPREFNLNVFQMKINWNSVEIKNKPTTCVLDTGVTSIPEFAVTSEVFTVQCTDVWSKVCYNVRYPASITYLHHKYLIG